MFLQARNSSNNEHRGIEGGFTSHNTLHNNPHSYADGGHVHDTCFVEVFM